MTVLITGAAGGFGRRFAREFASRGYDLILVDISDQGLKAMQQEFPSVSVEVLEADLSLVSDVKRVGKTFSGKVDVLINNAGVSTFGMPADASLSAELKMLDINVRAAHMLTRLFLPEMIKRNSGRILNISSLSAWVPVASLSAYSAGKAYLLSFSDGIQSELKALKITGVQVSVATPAFYHTNIGGSKLQVQGSAAAVDTFIGNLVIKFLAGKTLIVDKTYGLVPIMCGLWVRNLLRIILWRYVKKTVVRK